MRRGRVILAAAILAALSLAPAQAKKAPSDPGAQICELDWQASFGKIELKQTWSGAGELSREDLLIRRNIPVSSSSGGTLVLSQYTSRIDGKDYPTQLFYLSLGAPYNRGKNQRLVIAMPDGEPLVLDAGNGWLVTPLSEAQLARLLEAKGRLTFRFIKTDRRGKEKAILAEGWLDLSGFAGQPLGGLAEAGDRARSAMAQARKGDKPPCVMAYAAEANAMDSDEATRRWLSFDCREGWNNPLGTFELRETSFNWRPSPRDGVTVTFAGTFRTAPNAALQHFLLGPNDLQRYGQISVMFGPQDWGANYRVSDPALRERQFAELRRGNFVAGKWLSQDGSASFLWSEFAQLLAGEGDLSVAAFDKVNGATRLSKLPWSEVLAAEEELRSGQRRLIERERDPMARCKVVVDEELGTEQIIVT
jgi:hypothetical protein